MIQENLPTPNLSLDLDASLAPIDSTPIEDLTALNMVVQEFSAFENFRLINHDNRWNGYDSLYYGRLPVKYWEGTRVQRSALARRMSYDHVETAVPAVTSALFGSPDWFQVEADGDTDPIQAQAVQARLQYLLDHSKTRVGSPTQAEIRLAIRQALKYCNGGLELKYDTDLQQATAEWCDIRDIYVDPTCPTPNIDEATAVVRRKMLTVEQLEAMRFNPQTGTGDPRMKLPSLSFLQTAARSSQWAIGDMTKQVSEALRGVQYTPNDTSYSPVPSGQRVEVLIYYTTDRIIWVLDRRWLMYQGENPFGFIPFVFTPFVVVEGRFYGLGMIDAIASYQRYAESLQNNHLDEINLGLHPPRVIQNMPGMTPTMQAWRPGATMTTQMGQKASEVVNTAQISGVTNGAIDFVQMLDVMAEKSSGMNSMSMGIPRPSNANRTAGGMQMQASGASLRLSEFVKNIEDYLIVPMLDKLWRIEQLYSMNRQQVPAQGEGGVGKISTEFIRNAKPKFRMLASSKMLTKERLLQVLPFVMNSVMNGQIMGELTRTGRTIDFDQILKMIEDATGIGHLYQIIRPLNQQEQQAMQQPDPQQQMAQQQAQQDGQIRLQMGQMKVQGDQQVAQIQAQAKQQDTQARLAVEAAKLKQADSHKAVDAHLAQQQTATQQNQHANEMQHKFASLAQDHVNNTVAAKQQQDEVKNQILLELVRNSVEQRRWEQELALKSKQQ